MNGRFSVVLLLVGLAPIVAAADDRPNIIVILADDLGYADIGSFGAKDFETPHLDQMAKEGRRFTDFYVGAPACTGSRAALMTGCYPVRAGFADEASTRADGSFSPSRVLWPNSKFGINPDEVTVPEVLRDAGYVTGMVGKWHLGDAPKFNPIHHGFMEFFGAPYSHDMKPYYWLRGDQKEPGEPDLDNHVKRYTDEAQAFVRRHKDEPFFLYFAHHNPHTPLVASEKYKGKSKRGPYGDAVEELDWSVGQMFDQLHELNLDKRTLVIFTSDNGPWLHRGEQGGSAFPLRGGKGTTYEGGMREPYVMWWPDKIPAGSTCHEVASTMDFLPTFAALGGGKPPADRKIDGHDIRPLLTDDSAKSPWDAFYYFLGNELHAVRSGEWKLRAKNNLFNDDIYLKGSRKDVERAESLYNLRLDPGEQKSVLKDHPKIVAHLEKLLDEARADLGDSLTGVKPTNARPPGRAD
ncbi:MAG TPA: sulfatase [Lacipirellulaceae bacterium]|nr:sulfatase [Lacipirellulaceae bacterium]